MRAPQLVQTIFVIKYEISLEIFSLLSRSSRRRKKILKQPLRRCLFAGVDPCLCEKKLSPKYSLHRVPIMKRGIQRSRPSIDTDTLEKANALPEDRTCEIECS